jgi:hypothetical protein
MRNLSLASIPFALIIALAPALAKDQPAWKSEKDFRNAAPMVRRQAVWLEENPGAETWSDSLKTVLAWVRGVPYAALSTPKVFEKEIQNLPKDAESGRISSMLQVGYAQYATGPDSAKPAEFDLAKAGVTCMIRYYGNLKRAKRGYSNAGMEKLDGLMQSGALDEYIQGKLRK